MACMHIALLCFNTYPVISSGVLREHALRYSLVFSCMLASLRTYYANVLFSFFVFFVSLCSQLVAL